MSNIDHNHDDWVVDALDIKRVESPSPNEHVEPSPACHGNVLGLTIDDNAQGMGVSDEDISSPSTPSSGRNTPTDTVETSNDKSIV
ncbi:hypothetical protein A0H81_10099 [Grifola frondosa]|uniref:Uncharacterized protein n=1 Tax=Grifola frondosa TaxID=5627 RepID=A0A1C7LXY8_GRIFR|nr:hypothetical protein A0H81_10099 [Grifola frondosa]